MWQPNDQPAWEDEEDDHNFLDELEVSDYSDATYDSDYHDESSDGVGDQVLMNFAKDICTLHNKNLTPNHAISGP